MNVTAIFAHQDDEMRCLGAMLRCADRGDALHFITLTDGSKGFVQEPGIARAQAAAIRHAEMSALAAELGASFINLAEPDEFLFDSTAVRVKLIDAIRATRAELIFTHADLDYNLDHSITASLVRHCAMHACLPVLPTASPPLAAHPAVFQVEPHGAFAFSPTHYVDISAVHERKIALLAHHKSQDIALAQGVGSAIRGLCEQLSVYRGGQVGCVHAEAFVPMQSRGAIKPYPVLP